MSLRQRIRKETKELHDQLELQYPFNSLFESQNLKRDVENALKCFKCMFYDFLNEIEKEHVFFSQSLNQLNKLGPAIVTKEFSFKDDEILLLSMRYLFLGSRMGNRLLVQKNPKVTTFIGGEYFSIDCPSELWKSLLDDLESIEDINMQNRIVQQTKFLFTHLINIGAMTIRDE